METERFFPCLILLILSVTSLICTSKETGQVVFDAKVSDPVFADAPTVLVRIDPDRTIGVNNLSLGFMLDWEWKTWLDRPVLAQLAEDASFKLVRFFDFRSTNPRIMPCSSWNETTETGTFDWTWVDLLVQKILDLDGEPLICLGATGNNMSDYLPPGMLVDPSTGLPSPESYAAYATRWVEHFKAKEMPARCYEIINEPWGYFGWEPVNFTKLANYMRLFSAVAESMRKENPRLMISFDFIIRKPVLDYWLANGGADVDSLNFHDYGDWVAGRENDSKMFALAESQYFGEWPLGYTIEEARQVWFNARGRLLPVINSESNFNSAWESGTDPRTQQLAGAVWTALELRMSILEGLTYNVYYSFASSLSWGQQNTMTKGAGFGAVNTDDDQPWYPYLVQSMIGANLAVGDALLDITSSSEDVRALAWIHGSRLNVFLVCKANSPQELYLRGVPGELGLLKIDDTIPWSTPSIQKGMFNSTQPMLLNGYTVALLQAEATPR